ncbi:hypothetical protein [Cupriavidus sp. UME77]|uniref:hypothetical protein n=1 Tax=Cupriavidus sp. UME77 TaxID=1862321 RepID=UPI0015FF1065|nr:hypothetical protein [Cupriavidus sp. UME77]
MPNSCSGYSRHAHRGEAALCVYKRVAFGHSWQGVPIHAVLTDPGAVDAAIGGAGWLA